ncbi:MAG TPA: DUF58 domain-containing protein [Candidatus Kapabacteria bacterium]|nr:DUF58 domain-containing protein [Candidatus Kapabacteria bacterium]
MATDYKKFLEPGVISRLQNMELRARMVVEGFITGLHRSPYHGFSVEFAEHKQYMPGDEIRRIDWKIFGRTDRYYVKQYEEETNLKSYILLDASASMRYASEGNISKFQYATYVAAALAYLMVQQRDAAGLCVFDENVRTYMPPHSTRSYLQQVLKALEETQPANTTRVKNALDLVAERLKRRGLVIVLSDLFDDPQTVLNTFKHFRHDNHEMIVFHILDPRERDFAFGADALFTDIETAEQMPTQPFHIRKAYKEAMHQFIEKYKRGCREQLIDYVMIDTATPFDKVLFEYLGKRKRLD